MLPQPSNSLPLTPPYATHGLTDQIKFLGSQTAAVECLPCVSSNDFQRLCSKSKPESLAASRLLQSTALALVPIPCPCFLVSCS